jgi:tRNA pseudouridine65 synthase
MELLYRDTALAVFNKPSGLLMHRSPIDRHETRFALQEARNLLGQRVYPAHRLDKPTSGVLLFTTSPAIAGLLMPAFANGEVQKTYLAVARGVVPEAGNIVYPLAEETDACDDPRTCQDRAAQPAITEFRRLASVELPHAVGRYPTSRYSLVMASPLTGRRHQLRRHFKHLFHPLVGDTRYGEGRHNRFFRQQFDCHRLLLHAAELTLVHPLTGEHVTFTAPLDARFTQVLTALNWQETVPRSWLAAAR